MAGLGYTSGDNQSAVTTDQKVNAGGGSYLNLNLSSAGLQKGVPTWALMAGLAVAAVVAYKLLK